MDFSKSNKSKNDRFIQISSENYYLNSLNTTSKKVSEHDIKKQKALNNIKSIINKISEKNIYDLKSKFLKKWNKRRRKTLHVRLIKQNHKKIILEKSSESKSSEKKITDIDKDINKERKAINTEKEINKDIDKDKTINKEEEKGIRKELDIVKNIEKEKLINNVIEEDKENKIETVKEKDADINIKRNLEKDKLKDIDIEKENNIDIEKDKDIEKEINKDSEENKENNIAIEKEINKDSEENKENNIAIEKEKDIDIEKGENPEKVVDTGEEKIINIERDKGINIGKEEENDKGKDIKKDKDIKIEKENDININKDSEKDKDIDNGINIEANIKKDTDINIEKQKENSEKNKFEKKINVELLKRLINKQNDTLKYFFLKWKKFNYLNKKSNFHINKRQVKKIKFLPKDKSPDFFQKKKSKDELYNNMINILQKYDKSQKIKILSSLLIKFDDNNKNDAPEKTDNDLINYLLPLYNEGDKTKKNDIKKIILEILKSLEDKKMTKSNPSTPFNDSSFSFSFADINNNDKSEEDSITNSSMKNMSIKLYKRLRDIIQKNDAKKVYFDRWKENTNLNNYKKIVIKRIILNKKEKDDIVKKIKSSKKIPRNKNIDISDPNFGDKNYKSEEIMDNKNISKTEIKPEKDNSENLTENISKKKNSSLNAIYGLCYTEDFCEKNNENVSLYGNEESKKISDNIQPHFKEFLKEMNMSIATFNLFSFYSQLRDDKILLKKKFFPTWRKGISYLK